jgi:hypothetical protein
MKKRIRKIKNRNSLEESAKSRSGGKMTGERRRGKIVLYLIKKPG